MCSVKFRVGRAVVNTYKAKHCQQKETINIVIIIVIIVILYGIIENELDTVYFTCLIAPVSSTQVTNN